MRMMFEHFLPTRIIFGRGVAAELPRIIQQNFPPGPVLCLTDKGVRETGLVDSFLGDLDNVEIFDNVEANPRQRTVDQIASIARQLRPVVVVGLGGGSVLDAAKAVALLVTNPGSIGDYEGRGKYSQSPVPVVAVPTTCGTGSEVTWVAVITDEDRKFKMSIKGPEMYPRIALVDPETLKTLPPSLVAATGLDALTHAIEALAVKPATPLTDVLALEAIKLIVTWIKEAYADIKNNHLAREKIMLGSLIAGLAFGQSDVGAVHCLSEALGAWYDLPHGVANAVFLPLVMEFNLEYAQAKYARASYYLNLVDSSEEAGRAARRFLLKVSSLKRELGIPSARTLGLKEEDFPLLAQKAVENNSNPSNPRLVSYEDYLGLLRQALAEREEIEKG